MHFASLLTTAALVAIAQGGGLTLTGDFDSSNQNGVATFNGYVCTGALYVGCDQDVNNAFCCVGAAAQNNICNGGQPTTCTEGSYVPLTEAASAAASSTSADSGVTTSPASTSAQPTVASGSQPSSMASSTSRSTGAAPAATGYIVPGQIGVGLAAVVVKVLFL